MHRFIFKFKNSKASTFKVRFLCIIALHSHKAKIKYTCNTMLFRAISMASIKELT